MKMIGAVLLLAVTAAAQQKDTPTLVVDVNGINLNGGLHAQVYSLARAEIAGRPGLAAAVKISNPGKDYAFLLFYDYASAVDDAGVKFSGERADAIAGVEWCQIVPSERCFGVGNPAMAVPLEKYTQIDPGTSVTVHFLLIGPPRVEQGKTASVAAKYGYRIVKAAAIDNEPNVSAAQKLREVRRGTMSFEPLPVPEK